MHEFYGRYRQNGAKAVAALYTQLRSDRLLLRNRRFDPSEGSLRVYGRVPIDMGHSVQVSLASVSAWVYHYLPMRTITLALVFTVPTLGQWLNLPTPGIPRTADGKPNLTAPVPRMPDGKPDLSGLWKPELTPYRFDVIQDVKDEGVFRPAAKALFLQRAVNLRHDNPVTHCLPAGPQAIFAAGSTRFYRIVQSRGVIALLYELGDFRQIYTDGRELPKDPNPTWMGYSVGHWDGDTLVVDSAGFNDKTWLDMVGHPHSEHLRVT